MDLKILIPGNFALQIVLLGLLIYAGYIARYRRNLGRHCKVMRIAVILLIISVAVPMTLSMVGYTSAGVMLNWFYIEMYAHHMLGLAVIVLWVYINLAQSGRIKVSHRLTPYMRSAFILWVITFIMGAYMFVIVWI